MKLLGARIPGPLFALGAAAGTARELTGLALSPLTGPRPTQRAECTEDSHHPSDGLHGTYLVSTLAGDLAGFGLSMLTRLLPWAPVPTELAALPSVADHHPRLRAWLAERAGGRERADSATSIAGALAQGFASGGEGTLLDAAQRVEQWREAREHQRAWRAAQERLVDGPEVVPVAPERAASVPESPQDAYERDAMRFGGIVATAAVPFVGPRRAAAFGLAALPKATRAGQDAFGAHLGRVLARRGVLVMNRSVLRELGRISTVVLDERALGTGRLMPADLVPLAGSDPKAVAEQTWRLFDPAGPHAVRQGGGWTLGPLDELELRGRRGARERARLERGNPAAVLGLADGDRLEAVLSLTAEQASGVNTVTAAARRTGLPVLRPSAGADMAATVRELRSEGEVVLLVSGDRAALGAADCGLGVYPADARRPWGAHLLLGEDLDAAALLVEAADAARRLGAEDVRLAKVATGVGAISALQGGRARGGAAARGMRAVNAGAAVAMANGHRHARRLRPPEVTAEAGPSTAGWHLMPAEAVLRELDTSAEGLGGAAVRERARERGTVAARGTSLGSAFLAELANPLTPVLAGGAALSATVGSPVDAALVAGVTGLSAFLGSIQQVRTDRELAELLNRSAVTAHVRRDGRERTLSADELVVGDVVLLAAGDVVPADCRLLEADGLEQDESALTGESLPVAKDPAPVVAAEIAGRSAMLYEGTTVAAGTAVGVVVAVGDDTEAGRGMALARERAPRAGVEQRLAELTRNSMPLALGSAGAVAGAGLLHRVPLRESMSAAVNLAVASVPEGLPFLVNAAQLASARRLAEHGALVRNPRSVEALGRVDVLCFDKTGTLTEGTLAVSEVDDGRSRHRITALGESTRRVLAAALRATPAAERVEDLPHATDRAVLAGAARAGVPPESGAERWRLVREIPFEPSRGYHAAVGESASGPLLSVKGAPEAVLPRCAIDGGERKRLTTRMKQLAESGHRVLAVAEGEPAEDDRVAELRFRGFVAIADPVRGSAAPAAARLREAGVHIVMITGDHPATGEAIADEVNPGNGGLHVVTGPELDELDDEALAERLLRVDVVARCSPAQKVRIIQAYQGLGRTVAMTGDGANDAPAIRLADVGIALGARGTPAARAAADVVVTDDRLETIIAALVEGRAMWASVRESLGVLLGGNLGEITFSVLGALTTGRSQLTARQFLLVNLLTDLAPALAIALRRPDGGAVQDLLREGPENSLGGALRREIALRAGTTAAGASLAWWLARLTGRRRRAGTVALAALVGTQLGQTMFTGGRSVSVVATGLGSAAVLGLAIQTPGLSRFFGCTPLGPVGWGIAIGSAGAASLTGALLG